MVTGAQQHLWCLQSQLLLVVVVLLLLQSR
jgi:hypothetical protein